MSFDEVDNAYDAMARRDIADLDNEEVYAIAANLTATQARCTALLERRAVDWTSQLRSMFAAFEQALPERPGFPDEATVRLRVKLLREEVQETLDAVKARDLVEVADGCIDVVVVTLGMLLAFGIDPRPIWDEVMRTNFAKVEGGIQRSSDGKVMKPAGWVGPDLHAALVAQGWQPPKEAT